ncbi:hypothetical protein SLS62_002426 [Diatrype stigma]|uniref:Uncharacterized protein n=1 Tax=Diatrype stigma TaxID=117547 RepID=A0AAN9YV57_9PEZI
MASISLRSLIITRRQATARDNAGAASSRPDIWVTLGVILAALVVSSIAVFIIVLVLNRRRKNNKPKLPYVMKNPREWYRRHNSVREILEDEELARITQIRKSLQGRASSRNSQSSHMTTTTTATTATTATATTTTTTTKSTVTGPSVEFSIQEDSEVLRDDSKVWEHRLQSSPPTSTRVLEVQGHPAFSPTLPFPEASVAPTSENGTVLPERRRGPGPRRNTVGTPQPPSPVRIADTGRRRAQTRPTLPSPQEPQNWPLVQEWPLVTK